MCAKLQTEGEFMSKNNQMKNAVLGAPVPFAGKKSKEKKRKKRKRNAGVSLDAKFNID